MKKMLKILALSIAVLIMVTAMAGCGNSATTTKGGEAAASDSNTSTADTKPKLKPVTLKMWGGVPPESGPQEVCDNFNKEYESQGLKIEYERFVNDDAGNLKLDTNLISSGDIDLFVTYTMSNITKRATGGMELDLTSLIDRDNFKPEDIIGPVASTVKVNGKYYAYPTTKATNAWIVNKDMFDAAGIALPTAWTIDEFREIAKKLTKGEGPNKVYGFYLGSAQYKENAISTAFSVLGGNGYYKDATAKESNFDNPIFLKYLQTYTDMMNIDKTAVSHMDDVMQKLTPESEFITGKAAISPASFAIRSVKDAKTYPHTFKTAFVPLPTPNKGDKYIVPVGLGDNLCINSRSKNIEEAWEFLKWYTKGGLLPLAKGGRVPAYVKTDLKAVSGNFLADVENLFDIPSYENVFIKVYPEVQPTTITAKSPEIAKVAQDECEAALIGKIKPEDALKNMKKKADEFLKAQ